MWFAAVSIAGSAAATAMHAEQTTEVPAVKIFTHMVITLLAAAVYHVPPLLATGRNTTHGTATELKNR
jgi:cation transporter-like permease